MKVQKFLKRQLDFWGSWLLLLLFAVPFSIIAFLIRLDSKGPVFFYQERVGRDGKIFMMRKFRTMVEGAVRMGAGIELEKDDWRITRAGKWLRRFRIDEFPQLWHVVKGEMSLVGPRPALPHQVVQYTPLEKRRLEVKPGMAGMDMLKGGNLLSWKERIELDVWYIDHWSLWLDVRVLWGTFWAVVFREDEGKGAVKDYE